MRNPQIIQRLLRIQDPSVDQAIAAALPWAGRGELPSLARMLLSRGHAQALASLIEQFENLPSDLQEDLKTRIGDLHGACREAARRRGGAGPRLVIDLIRSTRSYKLVYLVAEQLRSGPVELRRSAAQCLLELTQQVVGADGDTSELGASIELTNASIPASEEARQEMQAAVEEGLLLYRHHHQPAVLLAFALLLSASNGKALSALEDPRQPAVEGLRQLILDAHEPAIIRHMLRWITVPTLVPVAAAALPRLCRAGKLATVLEQGELLMIGATRQALSKLKNPALLLPGDTDLREMPEASARWLSQWLLAIPLDAGTRIAQLARCTAMPHACTRLAALRALMQLSLSQNQADSSLDDDRHAVIAQFCHDENEGIALAALHHLLTVRYAGLHRLLMKLNQESGHESLRTLAARQMAPVGFEGLWRGWSTLGHAQRIAAARALFKLDDHFHRLLGQRLASDDARIRSRAMDMIASLHQGPLFEEPLISLARGPDEKLAASAVRALASCSSGAAGEVLEASLAHSCARVRANAVEALGAQRLTRSIDLLREMATREENRPRANAIAQLLRSGDDQAAGHLRSMLADPQASHRISALWAVEHESRLDVVGDVAEMIISDHDAGVRKRAGKALKELLARMQPVAFAEKEPAIG